MTYFHFKDHHYYICVILDLFARSVVGYKIGKKNSTQLAKSTFKLAYESRKPGKDLIFHTDRGTVYRSKSFCSYLQELNITQSYSRPYTPHDNAVMETFFSSLKREELYRTKYRSEKEFKTAVSDYIEFYNERRPHATNNYKTPKGKENDYYRSQAIFPDIF